MGIRTTAALAAGVVLIAAAPASAQATAVCNLTAPYRVVIGQPYKEFTVYASGVCSVTGTSGWDLIHPSQGSQGGAYFSGGNRQSWDVYDFHTIGLHTWRPSGAFDNNSNPLTQNTVQSDIRLATAAWISSKRTADVVTLTGTSLVYSTDYDKYYKRSAKGAFQFRERGTTTWKGLKGVTTSSAGVATMAYRYSKTRDYRFVLYTTPVSWDQASATTTR
ncbi:hypothetical protein [Kribbella sp. NPDC051770]|uniref:hypothetical protein n=1 Tax=Kribbella sp. NPDC051770 TaxID=3155413 RepID=UPI003440DC94